MAEGEQRLLLLVDSEPAQSRFIGGIAAREGWRSLLARDSAEALACLASRDASNLGAVLLDLPLSGDEACHLIREIRQFRPGLPILMLTASTSPQLAVDAMRAGATDYLIKPIAPDRILHALRAATVRTTDVDELAPLSEKLPAQPRFDAMVGSESSFRKALAVAAKGARGHGCVLVEGEAGTGKELLIRAIHAASIRAKAPLYILNIAAQSESSLESALFGHEKNAFPGAFERHTGAMQHCDGGTLALDGIEALSPALQARLLDSMRRGDVRPMGASFSYRVDTRILAASDVPLAELVAAGSYLPELAEILGATRVHLPPLRERQGDIAALSRHFLALIGEQPGLRELGITDGALALLKAYGWPGNVRQLQAVLFRAAVFCDGDALTAEDFPQLIDTVGAAPADDASPVASRASEGVTLFQQDGNLRPLEDIEADVIRLAIGHYRGRMTEVARRLGIGRSTLYRKLSELGIDNAA
jgi:DNA-binding NtrC family response regulator